MIEKTANKQFSDVSVKIGDRESVDNQNYEQSIFSKTDDKAYSIDCDGEIDATKQGQIGDCYLLSAVNAIEKNRPGFLKDVIKDNGDTIDVTFKGVKDKDGNFATYSINKADLELLDSENMMYPIYDEDGYMRTAIGLDGEYSKGDDDMLALEVAYEALRNDIGGGLVEDKYGNKEELPEDVSGNVLTGGQINEAYTHITGEGASWNFVNSVAGEEKLNNPQERQSIIGFSTPDHAQGDKAYVEIEGIKLPMQHAYTVTKMDDNSVSFVNPHDSSKELTLSMESFKKVAQRFTYRQEGYDKNSTLETSGAKKVDLSDKTQAIKEKIKEAQEELNNENPYNIISEKEEDKGFFGNLISKIVEFFKNLF